LMGKRITGHFFMEHAIRDGYHACDYLLACDMEMDPVPGYSFTSWESGYGDFHAVPDLATLRRAAWLPKTALVVCDLFAESGDAPIEVSPRRILQRQLERAAAHRRVPPGSTLAGRLETDIRVADQGNERNLACGDVGGDACFRSARRPGAGPSASAG